MAATMAMIQSPEKQTLKSVDVVLESPHNAMDSTDGSTKLGMPESPDASKTTLSHLSGWRLIFLTIGLCLSLFLVNLEVSIVSTSLVAVTDDLQGFRRSNWIVTGYLVTYTGFIIIWAKLSDILGRRFSILATIFIFTAFSAGCGASQTLSQLIICRVFQGIGGAGCYSLTIVIMFEMVPKSKYAVYGSLMSAVVSISTLLGPLFGGAINVHSTWRWIFLLNIPLGVVAAILVAASIPKNFPRQRNADCVSVGILGRFSRESLRKVDFAGFLLMISFTLLLVTTLLEVGTVFQWKSPVPIVLLILSALCLVAFLTWERHITGDQSQQQPLFPWRYFYNKPWMGIIIASFLVGIPFNVMIINLPQRFQTVDNISPLSAALRIIPYTFGPPLGSLIGNILASKTRIVPLYILCFGAVLQVVGLALLTTLSTSSDIPSALYGYEVITGFGIGIVFGVLLLLTPFAVEARDIATATGATIQFRMLGGAIGLAISANITNSWLLSHLSSVLNSTQIEQLLENTSIVDTFPSHTQEAIRQVFAQAYNVEAKVVTGVAAAQFFAILMMWRNPQLSARSTVNTQSNLQTTEQKS